MATASLFSLQYEHKHREYRATMNRGIFAQQMSPYLTSSNDSSSDSEVENRIVNQTHLVRNLMLKQSFKSLISNILAQRKQTDLNQSFIQVANDHKVFKVFQAWKRLKDQSTQKMAEAQFIIDRKLYEKKRGIFKTWANLVINSKKADLHFLGKIFGKMKDICSAELLARLKKIELTTLIQKKHINKLFKSIREDRQLSKTRLKKADQHYKFQLKQKTFESFTAAVHSLKKDNLKYHQFKMAHLFHRHILYRKYFNLLLIRPPTHFSNP